MKKEIAFIAIASLLSFNVHSQNKADDITGIWPTCGNSWATKNFILIHHQYIHATL